MFIETINTIGTLTNAYEIGKKTKPFLDRLIRRVRNRQFNIVICGASGTGKSTLGKILSGEFGRDDILQPYQISLRVEERDLLSETTDGLIQILPGQTRFWPEALRKIANSKVDLVINIVSYGYHSISQNDYQSFPAYQPGSNSKDFLNAYIEVRKNLEIDLLNQITPHLSIANSGKMVMITLVTKQDLWWSERYQVKDYYQMNAYNESIKNIQNTLGKFNFIHEYISASLLTENFSIGGGEILAPVSEGYDQRCQVANFDKLLQFIENNFEIELGR
jgi:energy-coupling factor transporter ATP-binding protein EcfA2